MGVSTKAIIRKGVTIEELKAHAEKKYGEVSIEKTHSDGFFYLVFEEGKRLRRSLGVFTDSEMAERDYGISGIILSLGCSGESVEIVTYFAEEFGGFVDENDCDDKDFYPVNVEKMEQAREYTPKEKFKHKLIKEFGLEAANKIIVACEEYSEL
jgi:hypothetical protein